MFVGYSYHCPNGYRAEIVKVSLDGDEDSLAACKGSLNREEIRDCLNCKLNYTRRKNELEETFDSIPFLQLDKPHHSPCTSQSSEQQVALSAQN